MIITSTQRQIPVTPRKMQLLANAVKHLSPLVAIEQLGFLNYSAALPLQKVIKATIANATNNHKLSADKLKIKEIIVTRGLTYKRSRAGARGRGKPYSRVRSHVTVKLQSPAAPIKKMPSAPAKTTTKSKAITNQPKTTTKSPK